MQNGLKALALQLSNLEFVKLLDRNTLKLRGDIGDDATSKIKGAAPRPPPRHAHPRST
jgi:hypothetical protein